MRIVVQIGNIYALEEFVYKVKDTVGQEEIRDIRLPADKFHLKSDPVIVLLTSSQGIIFMEDSSNVYFPITNKSIAYKDILPVNEELKLMTGDNEELRFTVYIGEETGMCFFKTERSRNISLGNRLDQTISCVDAPGISGSHLLIRRSSGVYRLHVKGKEGCYLNKCHIPYMASVPLNKGDVINTGELRLLWLDDHIGVERLCVNKPCIVRLVHVKDLGQLQIMNPQGRLMDFTPSPRNIIIPDDTEIELDAPPKKQEIRNRPIYIIIGPALTMAIPMSLGCGLYIYSSASSGLLHSSMFMYTGLITALSSAILGAFWAYLNIRQERRSAAGEEALRVKRYKGYIEDCNRLIRDKYRYNTNAMLRNSPSLREIFGNRNMIHIWNRRETEGKLFSYRLGTGTAEFDVCLKIPKESFSLTDDELTNLPGILKKRYSELKDVPVCTDIEAEPLQCFLSDNRMELEQLFMNIVLQIVATTGPELIRTVFMFTEGVISKDVIRLMRWLPQARGEDEHYVCTDRERVDEVMCGLEAMLRSSHTERRRWVLFTDDSRRIPISVYSEDNVSVLVFASEYAFIPGDCTKVIQNDASYRGILHLGGNDSRKEVCFDRISAGEAQLYVRRIA
ncbi:MAG: FHA domain-containing protein, partial [Lachnospiraceae bacterium]|nr:FHA domain-containing protein [Lachnospiraceae bacterium]